MTGATGTVPTAVGPPVLVGLGFAPITVPSGPDEAGGPPSSSSTGYGTTSVLGLEDDNGVIADGYSDETTENPFRFQGFAYDADSRTYDMQARAYQPDLARFTTPDRFEDAVGDFALQADPQTQDRYAFGAGNPINNVALDLQRRGSARGSTRTQIRLRVLASRRA